MDRRAGMAGSENPTDARLALQPPLPCEGLRVVAWEHAVAAPLATRHLADLGADVVKVERPGRGDFARDYDSVVNGLSAHFVWLNRGQRRVALDLQQVERVAPGRPPQVQRH